MKKNIIYIFAIFLIISNAYASNIKVPIKMKTSELLMMQQKKYGKNG